MRRRCSSRQVDACIESRIVLCYRQKQLLLSTADVHVLPKPPIEDPIQHAAWHK